MKSKYAKAEPSGQDDFRLRLPASAQDRRRKFGRAGDYLKLLSCRRLLDP